MPLLFAADRACARHRNEPPAWTLHTTSPKCSRSITRSLIPKTREVTADERIPAVAQLPLVRQLTCLWHLARPSGLTGRYSAECKPLK